jgi:2-oxoglutarate dehydrogenase E2 component (dihydrolipoamide succinyltransferase)
MPVEVIIPQVGESITEAQIGKWHKKPGDAVAKDETIAELETDKVTVELPAPASGTLGEVLVQQGQTAKVGAVIARINEGAPGSAAPAKSDGKPATEKADTAKPAAIAKADEPRVMPAAQRLLDEYHLTADQVQPSGPGGRLLKEDVIHHVEKQRAAQASAAPVAPAPATPAPASAGKAAREEEVVAMSPIRRRIAERLVQAQSTAALLTTYNEVDMSGIMALRERYKDDFLKRYNVKLGFMSFFVKATIEALKLCPAVNAEIRGTNIVYRNYYDIGVAVSTDRGLVVPNIRNAQSLSFAEIEIAINDFATRARGGKLKLEELEGGTFSITNGGVFGSLLSTPIINPPQSGILGMHTIQQRPVAVDNQVVIRPMMYVALTYDHRIIDGREAVTFLKRIKDGIEDPARLLLEV